MATATVQLAWRDPKRYLWPLGLVVPLLPLLGWGLVEATGLGLTKLFVEVVAESTSAVTLFRNLGFDPEALLVDHIRDRKGELRDLMVLAHALPDTWAAMGAAGIEEAVS